MAVSIGHTILGEAEQRFLRQFEVALESNPIEDGFSHSCQDLLRAYIEVKAANLPELMQVLEETEFSALQAPLLICLGRIGHPSEPTARSQIIQRALGNPDPQIRDAAIHAVENWQDPSLIPVLRSHKDDLDWLDSFIQEVVEGLG